MQEIRQQDQVKAGPELHFKGAAGERTVSGRHSRRLSILFRDFQHFSPIHCHDLGIWIFLGDRNTEQAVAGSDVQDFPILARFRPHQVGDQFGWQRHEGGH